MTNPFLIVMLIAVAGLLGCGSRDVESTAGPLEFDQQTGDFSFVDSSGNRVIYERAENTLIVEPDIDVEQLAVAFCEAEKQTPDPARFSAVSLVLAGALVPFIETVERVCER